MSEFPDWTRRKLYVVLALAIIPVAVRQVVREELSPSKPGRSATRPRKATTVA